MCTGRDSLTKAALASLRLSMNITLILCYHVAITSEEQQCGLDDERAVGERGKSLKRLMQTVPHSESWNSQRR